MAIPWDQIQGAVDDTLGEVGQAAVLTQGTATHNITLVDAGKVGPDDMGFQERLPMAHDRDGGGFAVSENLTNFVVSTEGGITPQKTDVITLATGKEFRIVNVKTTNPAGTALVHDVYAE